MTAGHERPAEAPGWSEERVGAARALVVGAGALGYEVAGHLARAGWGTLVLVDGDDVGHEDDAGASRAVALAAGVRGVNPDVRALALAGDLRLAVGAGLVARVDVVLCCLEDRDARIALAQLVARTGRLHIDGDAGPGAGTVRVFEGREGPCYGCGLTADDLRGIRLEPSGLAARRAGAVAAAPTTPSRASALGALMAEQALAGLHRDAPARSRATGREIRGDAAHDRFGTPTALPVNPECPVHALVPPGPPQLHVPGEVSWAEIVIEARALTGRGTVVHLPTPVLHRWECPACKAAGYLPPVAEVARDAERLACPACGADARPIRARWLNGTELWATASPRGTGLPAWPWLDAHGEEGSVVIELTGADDELEVLDRGR